MNRTDDKQSTHFAIEVPAGQRKAFRKMLQALEEAHVISDYREMELDESARSGNKPLGQNEQIQQYHDLID